MWSLICLTVVTKSCTLKPLSQQIDYCSHKENSAELLLILDSSHWYSWNPSMQVVCKKGISVWTIPTRTKQSISCWMEYEIHPLKAQKWMQSNHTYMKMKRTHLETSSFHLIFFFYWESTHGRDCKSVNVEELKCKKGLSFHLLSMSRCMGLYCWKNIVPAMAAQIKVL